MRVISFNDLEVGDRISGTVRGVRPGDPRQFLVLLSDGEFIDVPLVWFLRMSWKWKRIVAGEHIVIEYRGRRNMGTSSYTMNILRILGPGWELSNE